jgi:hypothetical protein
MFNYIVGYLFIGLILSSYVYYSIHDDLDMPRRSVIIFYIFLFYPFIIFLMILNLIVLKLFPKL